MNKILRAVGSFVRNLCQCVCNVGHNVKLYYLHKSTTTMAAPSKTGNRDSSQLAIAAEELIKAACTHVDSTSIALGKETVNGLKELSAGSAARKRRSMPG